MTLTTASYRGEKRNGGTGSYGAQLGPKSGGPGAGSTKAKGNSAALPPQEASPTGTGAQGDPPTTNSASGTVNPTSTGAGQGTVLKGGRGYGYTASHRS